MLCLGVLFLVFSLSFLLPFPPILDPLGRTGGQGRVPRLLDGGQGQGWTHGAQVRPGVPDESEEGKFCPSGDAPIPFRYQ